jgi:enoyl-CoA hydratase/carnithine racemase
MKTIVLSGAGKNALSTALMKRTLAELRAAKDAPLFLTGDGDAFSAGLNLKEVASLDLEGMTTFLGALEELVKALYEHPAPVVAWVNGHAIAGGCVLALCADMRVLTGREGVRIGLNEVALGLRFPPLTLAMVKARLTAPALQRVLLEADLYGAKEARELGLVDVIGEESEARAILSKRTTGRSRSRTRCRTGRVSLSRSRPLLRRRTDTMASRSHLVLVIDDEPQLVRAVRTILESRGYDVLEARSGSEAMDRLLERTPDLIVLDLTLPDVDGLELLPRIRSFTDIPILVLSARDSEE